MNTIYRLIIILCAALIMKQPWLVVPFWALCVVVNAFQLGVDTGAYEDFERLTRRSPSQAILSVLFPRCFRCVVHELFKMLVGGDS